MGERGEVVRELETAAEFVGDVDDDFVGEVLREGLRVPLRLVVWLADPVALCDLENDSSCEIDCDGVRVLVADVLGVTLDVGENEGVCVRVEENDKV